MKKFITLILTLILFLPLVNAALTNITKVDFINEPVQAYRLYNGDGISFIYNGKEYVVSVDDIGKTSIRLKSFVYKDNNEKETIYLLLDNRFSNKIDFDIDNYYDLRIELSKLEDDNVVILFEALHELKSGESTKNKINFDITTGILITAIIVVIGLIIYFIFKK